MKKVAIVTLNGYFNHGNRLQNYALQEAIKSLGFEIETLIINSEPGADAAKSKKIEYSLLKKSLYREMRIYLWKIRNKKTLNRLSSLRTKNFKRFTKDYINESSKVFSKSDFDREYCSKFDYFVTGSDQVWNPIYSKGSGLYFLDFAEINQRVAYAPSFGVSEIPEELKESYKQWLNGFEKISVREVDGARLVKELTGNEACVVLDPTMLISSDAWLNVVKKPDAEFPYLLVYFLGEISNEYWQKINFYAQIRNLRVLNLSDIKNQKEYVCGPSEFLGLIQSCELFCTDSFHGTVFSILFEKPFVVFRREHGIVGSMFSRLDTLLSTFDLSNRVYDLVSENDIFHVNFEGVKNILKVEKDKSYQFLARALEAEHK